MNVVEAAELLVTVRLADNRLGESEEPRAIMWAELLDDVSLPAALAAVKEHYRNCPDLINPGHIRPLVKVILARWKDQKRINGQRQLAAERAARGELEIKSTVTYTEDEKRELARTKEHTPENAQLLAELRAKLPPSRRGALNVNGSMASGKDRRSDAERSAERHVRTPQQFGPTLRRVVQQPEESR